MQECARWHQRAQLITAAAPAPGAFAAGQREFFWVKNPSILVLFLPSGIKQFQQGRAGVDAHPAAWPHRAHQYQVTERPEVKLFANLVTNYPRDAAPEPSPHL